MSLKYYLYISDAKIDMLLPQISHGLKKKVANEFKLSLKIFEAGYKSERESDDGRIARLQAVVQYLRSEVTLGSVDQPSEYLEGELEMKWGPYVLLAPGWGTTDPNSNRVRRPTDFVLFGGATEKTFCGLVGSAHHLLGRTAPSEGTEDYVGSALPDSLRYLEELAAGLTSTRPDDALGVLGALIDRMRGPAQKLEFIAKRLLEGRATYPPPIADVLKPKPHCILASPIYVAMAE